MKLKEGSNKFTSLPDRTIVHPQTPELDKLHAVKDKSQACGEFVEWLKEHKIVLAKIHEHTDHCYEDGDRVCGASKDELVLDMTRLEKHLANFFEIDLDKVEAEKRALLDEIRKVNEESK